VSDQEELIFSFVFNVFLDFTFANMHVHILP